MKRRTFLKAAVATAAAIVVPQAAEVPRANPAIDSGILTWPAKHSEKFTQAMEDYLAKLDCKFDLMPVKWTEDITEVFYSDDNGLTWKKAPDYDPDLGIHVG